MGVRRRVPARLAAGELLLVMRVLAVFPCPNPGRHPEVARLCLLPLGHGILRDAATFMLRQSLPPR